MKRRKFISTALLVSLSVSPVLASSNLANQPTTELETLLNALSAAPKKRYFIDKKLKKLYETSTKPWFLSGYKSLGSNYFLCQNGQVAIFPIKLLHETVGQIEVAALCFERTENGNWQRLPTLSGYHIEALTLAVKALKKERPNADLTTYLLPTQSKKYFQFGGYVTQKGEVNFKVNINATQTIIEAKVLADGGIIWKT